MKRFLADAKAALPAGSVVTDALQRAALGRDASFYRLVPKAVLKARSQEDIVRILHSASEHGVPVTFRAAGTSLSGQAVSDSVLVRLSMDDGCWTGVQLLDESASSVRLGPGVIGGQANSLLLPLGRRLGPDPASVDSAMMGGIVANNASGMCCGVAQNSYHTLINASVVFANGQVLDTADESSVTQFRGSAFGQRLLHGLASIREEVIANRTLAERIRKKFEIKCTTGYSMNAFTDFADPLEIMKHLLVGSEGTLAFLSSVSMATVPEHRHKASSFLLYANIRDACDAASSLKVAGVADAAELMDSAALLATKRQVNAGAQSYPGALRELLETADSCSAALLVEARGCSSDGLKERMELANEVLCKTNFTSYAGFSRDPLVCSSYWSVRKGLLPIAGSSRPRGSTLLLEDIAAPTDLLGRLTEDVQQLFLSLDYHETVLFGHALDGNLHLLFSEEFNPQGSSVRYAALMDRLCNLVVGKYDGSCKAEHGTGRNVAPFVELEWGSHVWDLMWRVKDLFDPKAVLNPGVILNRDPMVHLKDIKSTPPVHDLVDECIECGFCESVCPSKALTFTPRQRIAALRELEGVRTRQPSCLDASEASLAEEFEYAAKDTCAGDSMCATKCPVGIDTGAMVKDLRASSISPNERKLGDYVARHFSSTMSLLRTSLGVTEWLHTIFGDVGLSIAGKLLFMTTKSLGARVPLWNPSFPSANTSFAQDMRALMDTSGQAELAYLPSCSTRCMGPSTGSKDKSTTGAYVSLFQKAGASVTTSLACDSLCCGLAWESRGLRSAGDEMAAQYLNEAERLGGMQRPVLVDNSPCLERLRRISEEGNRQLRLIGPIEALQLVKQRLRWEPALSNIEIHVPCSAKIGYGAAESHAAIAKLLVGAVAREGAIVSSSGVACCGMAGDRGLRFPELVEAATSSRVPGLSARRDATRVSISRTCEIAMSASSLPVLMDQCASELK